MARRGGGVQRYISVIETLHTVIGLFSASKCAYMSDQSKFEMSIRCLGRRLPPGQASKQRLRTSLSLFHLDFPEKWNGMILNNHESGDKTEGIER